MRRMFLLAVALSLATAMTVAQTHDNSTEKAVRQTIVFDADTHVGPNLLKAGEYRVVCDRETIEFRGPDGKKFRYPCKGEELSSPSTNNQQHMTAGPDDTKVLVKLLLKGSAIQHTFD